ALTRIKRHCFGTTGRCGESGENPPITSDDKYGCPGSPALLQRPVRLAGILQGEFLADLDLHRPGLEDTEETVGGGLKLGALRQILAICRPGAQQRALALQQRLLDGRCSTGRLAERPPRAARLQTIERAGEGILAYRVIDDVDAGAIRDRLDAGDEIARAI